jgi:hypothetical protein
MGRPVLLSVFGIMIIGAMVLRMLGSTDERNTRVATAVAGTSLESLQQQPTNIAQGVPLPGMPGT